MGSPPSLLSLAISTRPRARNRIPPPSLFSRTISSGSREGVYRFQSCSRPSCASETSVQRTRVVEMDSKLPWNRRNVVESVIAFRSSPPFSFFLFVSVFSRDRYPFVSASVADHVLSTYRHQPNRRAEFPFFRHSLLSELPSVFI